MEAQTENSKPPPSESQSSGKINKAAFKLFGKRRSGGSGMPSIFSMRNKGEGGGNKAAGKALELVRSKTHDGITSEAISATSPMSDTSGGGKQPGESASSDQLHDGSSPLAPAARSTLSKSFSFFSLLRRNSMRGGDGAGLGGGASGGAGEGGTAGTVVGRRARGLRGFFSSFRWRRKERPSQEEVNVVESQQAKEGKEVGGVRTTSQSDSVEVITENVTLMLTPEPQVLGSEEACGSTTTTTHSRSGNSEGTTQDPHDTDVGGDSPLSPNAVFEERSPDISPLRVSYGGPHGGQLDSPARLASTDSCMTPTLERSLADPPSEPSVDRLCSMFNDVTSLKSFDSLTGCGDIIADVEDEPGNGNGNGSSGTSSGMVGSTGAGTRRASDKNSPGKAAQAPSISSTSVPVSTFLPAHQRARAAASVAAAAAKKPSAPPLAQGSGVVAYMGGGEEMASPEGVDDADMQGLWHMLPQKGEDSPDLPRSEHGVHHTPPCRPDSKRPPALKSLGLSKIPVCGSGTGGAGGSGRQGKQQQPKRPSPPPLTDKDLQDAPPSDEGYWDSPTPVAEDDDNTFLQREIRLPRESCSGDALYDLYDPDSPGAVGSDDEKSSPTLSAGDVSLSPQSQVQSSSFRSLKGSTSLPRDSKIPISVRQTPPPSHSSSQGELSTTSAVSPTSREPPKSGLQPPRTRIPISKVPVRRTGNKPVNPSTSRTRK